MKVIVALLLLFASLLWAATAVMQAIMGHWLYMAMAFVMAAVMAALSGITASAP